MFFSAAAQTQNESPIAANAITDVSFVACESPASAPTSRAAAAVGAHANLHAARAVRNIAAAKIISCTKYPEYIWNTADIERHATAAHAAPRPMYLPVSSSATSASTAIGVIAFRKSPIVAQDEGGSFTQSAQ